MARYPRFRAKSKPLSAKVTIHMFKLLALLTLERMKKIPPYLMVFLLDILLPFLYIRLIPHPKASSYHRLPFVFIGMSFIPLRGVAERTSAVKWSGVMSDDAK